MLNSTLDSGKRTNSRPDHFTPREETNSAFIELNAARVMSHLWE